MQNVDIARDSGERTAFSGDIPVLFLVWVRPELAAKVFSQIRKAQPKRLYVALDGPRNEKDEELIKKTLEVIKVDWDCDVKYLKRDKNLGCKVAVAEAITWFFENEEMGIILEDDCYPDLSFFPYCEELLNRFKDDTRIMSIGGYGGYWPDAKYSYDFTKHFGVWGWASWRRAWKYFDIDMSDFALFEEEKAIERYVVNVFDRVNLNHNFSLHASHDQTTWDWIWCYNIYCQNALCISPTVGMIENIGFDSDNAAHEADSKASLKANKMEFPLRHPHFIGVNPSFNRSEVFKSCLKLVKRKFFRLISNLIPEKKMRQRVRNMVN